MTTIKNKTVTREQYDKLQSNFDFVYKKSAEYGIYSREVRKQLESKIRKLHRWIAALALLSVAQSIVLFMSG